MTIGNLKKIIGPMDDSRDVFLDAEALEELVEIDSAAPDGDGDLIVSADFELEEPD